MPKRPRSIDLLVERPTITAAQAEQKLRLALGRLGLGFAHAANFVSFDPDAESAYWRFDHQSGEEQICIGPSVALLDVEAVEVVLRHELLHRSMYHGFRERYTNHELSNLTLDICINRLLYAAYPAAMRRASAALYPEDSKTTPIALADCTAQASRLPDALRELWRSIWHRSGPSGTSLNPSSLYYQLMRIGAATGIPAWYSVRFTVVGTEIGPLTQRAIDHALRDLTARLPRGSRLAAGLSEFTASPVEIGADQAEAFVRAMRLRTAIRAAAGAVTEHLTASAQVQPFPLFPTRLGTVYRAVGLSAATGLYWNRGTLATGGRLALGIYVDVSGSMQQHYPVVVSLVDALKEYPLRIRAFTTTVFDVELDAFTTGTITGGGGTDFDAPVRDLVRDRDVVAGLLITDGEARLSADVGRSLARHGKRLFVIYLRERRRHRQASADPLAAYATATIELPPSLLTRP